MRHPRFLLALGLSLMLTGVVLPFLMVVHILDSTFLLNFLSSGSSTLGLALSMIGFARLTRSR